MDNKYKCGIISALVYFLCIELCKPPAPKKPSSANQRRDRGDDNSDDEYDFYAPRRRRIEGREERRVQGKDYGQVPYRRR